MVIDQPINGTPHEPEQSTHDPKHPCQTPHRSYPRHYDVSLLEGGVLNLLKARCTTCGRIADVMADRWDGQ